MDNKAIEKTGLVIKALEYAHKHKLDINNKNDVKNIVERLDPQHAKNDEIEEFMNLLQNAETFLEIKTSKKATEETKLPN